MFARLIDSGRGFAEIARLTDRQIVDVICHERDRETGEVVERLEAQPEGRRLSAKEQDRRALLILGRTLKIPHEELQAKWAEKYPGETLVDDYG